MQIERNIIRDLLEWKDSPRRKPLLLKGVRQCGKTWTLKHFGESRHLIGLRRRIAVRHAEQHQKSLPDFSDNLAIYANRCLQNSLYPRFHC